MRLETEQQIKDFCAEQAREIPNPVAIFDRLWAALDDEWIEDVIAEAIAREPNQARDCIIQNLYSKSSRFGDVAYAICYERWIGNAIRNRNEPSQGDINREAEARDNQQRREDLKREVA